MSLIFDVLSWVSLVAGGVLLLISGIGLIRFPDLFSRMHAVSITDTGGTALILLGLLFQAGFTQVGLKVVLIFLFLLITGPAATHALAKAALHGGQRPLLSHSEERT